MNTPAITIDGLGKRYRLGSRAVRPETLVGALGGWMRAPWANLRRLRRLTRFADDHADNAADDILWALRDVSFAVPRGTVMGLIGHNGAGKTTLLKILSRITEPTAGRAVLRGRVSSLLEVGTGFHPELSGRENVFLNGAVLGMTRPEVTRKFDEIVAFAGVERFIDTPIKRYSTGMKVRLAFSVAAHLEPEILLIDEVLAVGDLAFQRKCLGKMEEVAGQGRTVVFVSHDMTNVSLLCDQAVLLKQGRVAQIGPVTAVIDAYLSDGASGRQVQAWPPGEAPGDDRARLTEVRVMREDGGHAESYDLVEPILLQMTFHVETAGRRLNPVFIVKNKAGVTLFSTANYAEPEWGARTYPRGVFTARCRVPAHILNEGGYVVDALVVEDSRAVAAAARTAVTFHIHDTGKTRGDYLGEWVGMVRPVCDWTVTPVETLIGRTT